MSTEAVTNPVAQAADYIEKNLCRCVVNRSVCPVHYGNKVYDPVPVTYKPFFCKIGFHIYISAGIRDVITPKVGPYDPRSDAQRTTKSLVDVCAQCGKTRQFPTGVEVDWSM